MADRDVKERVSRKAVDENLVLAFRIGNYYGYIGKPEGEENEHTK